MEFKLQEFKQLPKVEFNYQELKAEIESQLERFKGITYDESAIVLAKDDRAKLNALSKALNDAKVEVKKRLLEPYLEFEIQIKEIMSMVEKQANEIDIQVKKFEEAEKLEKRKEIENIFNEKIGELIGLASIVKLDSIFNPKWLNKVTSLKVIKTEISNTLIKIESDFNTIKTMKSEFETEVLTAFIKNGYDVAIALKKNFELTDHKKRLEELARLKQEALNRQNNEVKEAVQAITPEKEEVAQKPIINGENEVKKQLKIMKFSCKVDREQYGLLVKFLVDNNIPYEHI